MASLLCARECLLIFLPLANGRRKPTHSWLLYPLLMLGLTQLVATMALRATVGASKESTSPLGVRLVAPSFHCESERSFLHSFPEGAQLLR